MKKRRQKQPTNMPLPCPFCGAEPAMYYLGGATVIRCRNTQCQTTVFVLLYQRHDAIEAWNRRSGH